MSFTKYQKALRSSGLPQSTTFTLGDERGGKSISMDEKRAPEQFKSASLIVQKDRFKDAAQRNSHFSEDPANELQRTNAILRRPCLLFPADDTCLLIHMIRRYFKITLASRATGPGARRENGEKYVTARDVRVHVLENIFHSSWHTQESSISRWVLMFSGVRLPTFSLMYIKTRFDSPPVRLCIVKYW